MQSELGSAGGCGVFGCGIPLQKMFSFLRPIDSPKTYPNLLVFFFLFFYFLYILSFRTLKNF